VINLGFLPKRKNSRDLMQTVYANSFAFEIMNLHRFTAKYAGVKLCFCERSRFKGNNNSLMSWLLVRGSRADV